MPAPPDKAKQVLEEALRELYGHAAVTGKEPARNYLQGGDGQFLGKITDNQYDRESIVNSYGPFGSKYSRTSIHNPYSQYGSPYSQLSINSPYATNPPILFLNGAPRGVVSKNPYQQNRIKTDVFLYLLDKKLLQLLNNNIPDRAPQAIAARAFLQAADGTFIGSLEQNSFLPDSIFNKFGPYGSQFSPTSIFNKFGNFGSEYSALSPYNSFTTTPPVIIVDGRPVAQLTKNTFLSGEKVDPEQLEAWLRQRGL